MDGEGNTLYPLVGFTDRQITDGILLWDRVSDLELNISTRRAFMFLSVFQMSADHKSRDGSGSITPSSPW
jgi:hypothetical protein